SEAWATLERLRAEGEEEPAEALLAARAEVERLAKRVEHLEGIISGARYCLSIENDAAARACLDGNGLEPGVAEDLKSDLDRCYERIDVLAKERDALRARV